MSALETTRRTNLRSFSLFFVGLVGFAIPLLTLTNLKINAGFVWGIILGILSGILTYVILLFLMETFASETKKANWKVMLGGGIWSLLWGT